MKLVVKVPSVAFTHDKKLLRRILGQAGRTIAQTARSLIRSGSGNRPHITSTPGGPPMSLTGALAASLKVRVKGDRVSVRDTQFYAKFLETGAKGGGGKKGSANKRKRGQNLPQTQRVLLPRPFVSVAADREMPDLQQQISKALAQGIDLKVLRKAAP